MEKDLGGLYKELEEDHNNWELWGILADCYEDMGWEYTKDLREVLKYKRRAYKRRNSYGWLWFLREQPRLGKTQSIDNGYDFESDLPKPWFKLVKLSNHNIEDMKIAGTLREATEACCIAWNKLENKP